MMQGVRCSVHMLQRPLGAAVLRRAMPTSGAIRALSGYQFSSGKPLLLGWLMIMRYLPSVPNVTLRVGVAKMPSPEA
jgi:hypothetical protein